MRTTRIFFVLATTLSIFPLLTLEAGAIAIDVSINGQVKHCDSSPCTLSANDVPTGAGFTLNSGEVTADDVNPDHINLKNLEIIANTNNASGTIIFWAIFNGPPDADSNNPKGYYHSAKGNLRNGSENQASVNSWVKLTGLVQDDEIVGTYQKTVTCAPLACGEFLINPAQKETWWDLSGTRTQKGKLEFLLKTTGHKLKMMDPNNPQKITSGQAGGGATLSELKDNMRARSGVSQKTRENSDCKKHANPDGDCPVDWLNR